MKVELLYFDDCPNWRQTAEMLDEFAAEVGFTWSAVAVDTLEAALQVQFHGSPSIRINGVDPFGQAGAPVGLMCRIYRTPTGPAGSPNRSELGHASE